MIIEIYSQSESLRRLQWEVRCWDAFKLELPIGSAKFEFVDLERSKLEQFDWRSVNSWPVVKSNTDFRDLNFDRLPGVIYPQHFSSFAFESEVLIQNVYDFTASLQANKSIVEHQNSQCEFHK